MVRSYDGDDDGIGDYTIDEYRLSIRTGDVYEPDNTFADAKDQILNTTATHSIDPGVEADYVKFTLATTSDVTITTNGPAGGDTHLKLYSSAQALLLENEDASPTNDYAKIDPTPLSGGTYYYAVVTSTDEAAIPEYTIEITATGASNALEISGTIQTADQNGTLHPVMYAKVQAFDKTATGETLLQNGETSTDANGNYSVTVTNNEADGLDVFIKVFAEGKSTGYPGTTSTITLVRRWNESTAYEISTPVQNNVTTSTVTINHDITMGNDGEDVVKGFSVFNSIVKGFTLCHEKLLNNNEQPVEMPANVVVYPSQGGGTDFNPQTRDIRIADLYCWDRDVILHEYGHYVAQSAPVVLGGFAQDYNVGCPEHQWRTNLLTTPCNRTPAQAMNLSFSEAWATFFAVAIQFDETNDRVFDQSRSSGPVFQVDLDDETLYHNSPGEYYETQVLALLWDMFDDRNATTITNDPIDNNDYFSTGFTASFPDDRLWKTLRLYHPNTIQDFWIDWFAWCQNNREVTRIFVDHEMDFIAQPVDNPQPSDGSTGVSTLVDLEWDATSTASSYDVYFGTSPNLGTSEYKGNTIGDTWNLGTLHDNTVYYWQIISKDGTAEAESPIWSFTTGSSGSPITFNYNMNYDWNLVSIPLEVPSFNRFAVFPGHTGNVFIYDGRYVMRDELDRGHGYWVKYASAQTVQYVGPASSSLDIEVKAGWNMIGANYQDVDYRKVVTDPPSILASPFKRYVGGGNYASLTETDPNLVAGNGYWIKVSSNGVITLDPSQTLQSITLPSADPPPAPYNIELIPPALYLPDWGELNQPTTLQFSWSTVTGATNYRFQLSTSGSFSSLIVDDATLTATTRIVSSLNYSTHYYWRVNASNDSASSEWSEVWLFTTQAPPPPTPATPTLLSPANGATNTDVNLYVNWNAANYAEKYHVQVSQYSNFNSLKVNNPNVYGTSYLVQYLAYNTTYYWRVKSINSGGQSSWSSTWHFTTGGAPDPCAASIAYIDMDELTVTDSAGYYQEFFVRNDDIPLGPGLYANDEMPPEPPPGIFHARFKSGKYVEVVKPGSGNKMIPIKLRDAKYPITILWNSKSLNKLNLKLLKREKHKPNEEILLADSGSITITSNANDLVMIQAAAAPPPCDRAKTYASDPVPTQAASPKPIVYSLGQNSPNPFNPQTQIRYQLPEDAYVTLKVYNALGQVVGTLVDGSQAAGFKSTVWNASQIASGVYFYRIEATGISNPRQTFTQVMKMVVLK